MKADGVEIDSITIRRPKVSDVIISNKSKGSDIEQEVRLIANLSELSPKTIESLDLCDYKKVAQKLSGFFS